jgi:hypothetical protein
MARIFVSGQNDSMPDTTECRVLSSVSDGLCLCLNPRPQGCKYVEQYHLLNFCFHPERSEFAKKTESEFGNGL